MNAAQSFKAIDLGIDLDSSSSGDELGLQDPYATQAVGIQASPDRSATVSPDIMQPLAGGNSMKAFQTRKVRFEASADSEGRRKPPTFLKYKSQEVSREMKDPSGKTIRDCIDKIEKIIIATHGSQAEKVAAVTKVVAIAVELADAEQKQKAAQRRKELARKRKELKAELKAEQARLALKNMSEDQQALLNKH